MEKLNALLYDIENNKSTEDMLVTAYYDIYGKPERFLEYLSLFYDLGVSGIPMILFTDPSLVSKFRIFPASVIVVGMPLSAFELYNIAMKYDGELPPTRNVQKDTKEFFALMNTKMEFVKKAAEIALEEQTFMWIDFGILKIMKNPERVITMLKEIQGKTFTKFTIPGCWSYGRAFTVNAIHWRFCGGFFVIPRNHVERFYNHSKCVLTDFCTQPIYKLTWETNVWTLIEFCAEKDNIEWYFADHNDTMILNIDSILT